MLALEGIRMLDLSRMGPGPFCSMLLGDMGVDVLMVEAPPSRLPSGGVTIPRPAGEGAAKAAAYNAAGRNKRSIILDLRNEESREIFYRLAETADVVLEGFRPGVVKRLGVDYETLRNINDRLVYCSISGYGQDGPYAGLAGHDINYISIGGALGMIGWPGAPPAIPMNIVADFGGGGLNAAFAIVVALMARERTGKGQYIDMALSDGVLQLLAPTAINYFFTGEVPRPGAANLNGRLPYYNVYECADGKWISVGALESHFFANLCKMLDCEEFVEHQHNADKYPEMRKGFAEKFRERTRDEWFQALQQTDTCAGPVYSLDEAVADPQNQHREMVIEVEVPGIGKVQQIGISAKLSETPGSVRSTAPVPGQHTDEVLRALGFTADQIAGLRQAGAVE